jgi:hypothetical protein
MTKKLNEKHTENMLPDVIGVLRSANYLQDSPPTLKVFNKSALIVKLFPLFSTLLKNLFTVNEHLIVPTISHVATPDPKIVSN